MNDKDFVSIDSPIIILGMHRSGTSAVSNIVESCGYTFGNNLIAAAADNPRGFFEDKQLVAINDQHLGGPKGWTHVSPPKDIGSPALTAEAQQWYQQLNQPGSGPIALKDPRLCRLLDLWLQVIDNPKVILVSRSPSAVAASLRSRDALHPLHSTILWVVYHYEAIQTVVEHQLTCLCINYDQLIQSPSTTTSVIREFTGSDQVDASRVETELRHNLPAEDTVEIPAEIAAMAEGIFQLISSNNLPSIAKYENQYRELIQTYGFVDTLISSHEGEKSNLEDDLSNANLINEEQRDHIAELTATNNAILHSKSRRLTKPLRGLKYPIKIFSRSKIAVLVWAIKNKTFRHIEALAQSSQTPEALNVMVELRNSTEISTSSRQRLNVDQDWPAITISVVTYNNGHWIDQYMQSVVNQNYPLDKIHIIFTDNSSTDNTPELLASAKEQYSDKFACFSVSSQPNYGFGSGHDIAIRAATTDFVLVSNIDLEFTPSSITEVVSTAIGNETTASWELRQAPYEHPKFVDPVSLCVNWSSHACVLLSRDKYIAVGGYEKRIFMYGEDVELSYRFRRAGYLLKYVPSAVVNHYTYRETKVKPIQFQGSVLANYYNRLRYGTATDIAGGVFLLLALTVKGGGFKGSRRLIVSTLPKALINTPAFLLSKKKSSAYFPFRGFDYDLVRDGAFYEIAPNTPSNSEKPLPLVTIVTRTVEGRRALLKQAMISVINQTYPNIEHLIIEDGGNSAESLITTVQELGLNGYATRHVACEKLGRSHAGNQGMATATGDYIVILDDDDLLFPDHVEVLYQALVDEGTDAAYTLAWDTPTHYIDKEQAIYREVDHTTLPMFHQPFDKEVLKHHNYLPIQSVLFKKSLFEKYGGFDEDMSHLEDWVLWKKFAHYGEFTFVPKTTSLYKTPADIGEILARKTLLDRAYDDAKIRPILPRD